jgi:hypothetical protein
MFDVVEQDYSNNLKIRCSAMSLFPLDSEYTWDNEYEVAIRKEMVKQLSEHVSTILKDFECEAEGYDQDEELDATLNLTGDDFYLTITYTDSGYYGASIEIEATCTNQCVYYADETVKDLLYFICDRLNQDEIYNEAANDAYSNCCHLLTLDEELCD